MTYICPVVLCLTFHTCPNPPLPIGLSPSEKKSSFEDSFSRPSLTEGDRLKILTPTLFVEIFESILFF